MRTLLVVMVSGVTLAASSSTIKTSRFDVANWQPVGPQVEGPTYYEPHQVVITHEYTALTDKGKLVGTAENRVCEPIIQKQEIVIEPNFSEPRVQPKQPSPLSGGKLSVSLSNGIITNVNPESAPRTPGLVKEVTGFVREAGMLPLTKQAGQPPACNAAPMIRSKVPYAAK